MTYDLDWAGEGGPRDALYGQRRRATEAFFQAYYVRRGADITRRGGGALGRAAIWVKARKWPFWMPPQDWGEILLPETRPVPRRRFVAARGA
jgi:hypothetical protein